MLLRKSLLPKTFADIGAVIFLIVTVQIIYWFELFLVFPQYYENHEFFYYAHSGFGTWLMFNIVGNYVITYLSDTSIRGRFLSAEQQKDWRLCDVCETLVPPRSWHCSVCNICILKRDHHCNFTACCVGHENQRHFTMFLVHLSIATMYASYFNVWFLWKHWSFSMGATIRLVFPFAGFLLKGETSQEQLYKLFCVITVVGMVAAVTLTCYHVNNILNGQVMNERAKNNFSYDLGKKANVEQALGDRWHLIWLSPFISSKLPGDGIDWNFVRKAATKSK